MEAEATGLADQALRVQQQAARRSWRAWLEDNTTAGAAKVHQLIREPTGFQAARGNAVDEQLKQRDTWAAVWRANAAEPALALPTGRSFTDHRRTRCARCSTLSARSRGWYDAEPPRTLNELPKEALIDLIMPIEEKMRRRREVCGPSGYCHRACAVQASANRGQDVGGQEHRGLLLGHSGAWRRAVCLGAGSME